MSQENVELVRRAFAAFAEEGVEGLARFSADDIVIHALPDWPDDAEYRGPDGLRRLIGEWTKLFDAWELRADELKPVGGAVVVRVVMVGRLRGAQTPVHQEVGGVYSAIDGGRIGEVRFFSTWDDALAAAAG